MGGDQIIYNGNLVTPIANLTAAKIHLKTWYPQKEQDTQ